MQYLLDGLGEAIGYLVSMEPSVVSAAFRSVWISSLAVLMATVGGVPLGSWLARAVFPGRWLAVLTLRVAMAFPTVFVGLVCFAMFSRRGPLGSLELLYTPWLIVIGEFVLALPIIASLTHGAVFSLDSRVHETAITLGASPVRRWLTYISEARTGITLAVLTAFARCVTELGIAMMVGGNVKGRTRTLATATAMETDKGAFAQGLAMGLILLMIALIVTATIGWLNRENKV